MGGGFTIEWSWDCVLVDFVANICARFPFVDLRMRKPRGFEAVVTFYGWLRRMPTVLSELAAGDALLRERGGGIASCSGCFSGDFGSFDGGIQVGCD